MNVTKKESLIYELGNYHNRDHHDPHLTGRDVSNLEVQGLDRILNNAIIGHRRMLTGSACLSSSEVQQR